MSKQTYKEYLQNLSPDKKQRKKKRNAIWMKEKYAKDENYRKQLLNTIRRRNETSIKARLSVLLRCAKVRAKKYKLDFDLDIEFLLKIYNEQDGNCKMTGIKFILYLGETKNNYRPYSPSIDRIIPQKGYTKSNIRIVCTIVNISLKNFGDANFEKMCRAYIANKNKTE